MLSERQEINEQKLTAAYDRQANGYLPADAKCAPHTPIGVEDKFSINVLVERLVMEFGVDREATREICSRWYAEF